MDGQQTDLTKKGDVLMKNLDKTRVSAIGRRGIIVFVAALVVLIWATSALSQRGMTARVLRS